MSETADRSWIAEKVVYKNVLGKAGFIHIERDVIEGRDEFVPVDKNTILDYIFKDSKGEDITDLRRLFYWQAYSFYHVNPYKVLDIHSKLREEDFVSDSLGKRLRPDVDSLKEGVGCLETRLEVQQSWRDGKIWISFPWLHSGSLFDEIYDVIEEVAAGDKKLFDRLWRRYERISYEDIDVFKLYINKYFKDGKMRRRFWSERYALAASKEWRIKTMEQLNEALEVEQVQFSSRLEELIEWLRGKGIKLGEGGEESLRKRIRELYERAIRGYVCKLIEHLIEEDRKQPIVFYTSMYS